MALEGTHIRLAVDMLDKQNIQDLGAYISGTVYPDSRYVTKIERILTHDTSYLEKEFAKNDFNRGWRLHLLCDHIQKRMIMEMLGEKDNAIEQNSELWINITAVKILQEISDLRIFDISSYLQYVKPSLIPNCENEDGLKKYYDEVRKLYFKGNLQPGDYGEIFILFGIPSDVRDNIFLRCDELQKNGTKMKRINELYDEMFKEILLRN